MRSRLLLPRCSRSFVAAAIDNRIDAIAPAIAWHSLLTALYREDTPKSGWGAALYGLGAPTATIEGAISPAGVQTGKLDPHISSALTSGLATGRFSDEDRAWFDSRGPGDTLVGRVRVPTPSPRAPALRWPRTAQAGSWSTRATRPRAR